MKETKQIYYKLFVLVKRWEKIKVKVEEAGRNAVRRVDEQRETTKMVHHHLQVPPQLQQL